MHRKYDDIVKMLNGYVTRPLTDREKSEAFIHASTYGYVEIVKLFLDNGVDPNSKTDFGDPALHYAVDEEHIDVVELLLKRGANPNTVIGENRRCDFLIGSTPLSLAEGNDAITQMLLDHGAHKPEK